ncbi:MAG: lactate utilization protein [Chloroflexi bacterium]|nr:lactate utilization protein [Chloroflexota bacterium]MDA1219285.1 lactate utilization protein [Chloroflexota bacterium]
MLTRATDNVSSSLEIPKDEFLASVRHALGRQTGSAPVPPYPHLEESLAQLESLALEMERRVAHNRDALLTKLAETAQLRGWNVCRAANPEAAISYVESVVTGLKVGQVVRSAQEIFDQLPVERALLDLGIGVVAIANDDQHTREQLRNEIIAAGVGITGVDYAVSETGSVVVMPRQGLSRLVSLVPPVHIALVRAQDVVESLDDVFLLRRVEYHRHGGDMGSYLNFITGPSRTADIEQTIVIGVHGPKEAHMVLLG